ncbi:XRE family transcriptional regulator [Qipengyuania aquimaris]|uniref:XRE family transcriptional regulator n=1 Tax=Qipengyuania aquimaris TaxID=255984 RepID=A0A9Q3S2P4_9SPHN|nr:XRE family transcriptional regulator [Qipengyuania aquimaris]MBY6219013.1 XRE family transcriptional regulator [Qipengyuania aquimaris]
MARAALKWSIDDLAEAANVARMTVVRFEREDRVSDTSTAAMRLAFEEKRVKFVDKGRLAGAVYGGMRRA